MTYRPRSTCMRCGRSREAVGHLSRRGNCLDCGIRAEADNITQMRGKAGPFYVAWRDAIIDWVASLPGAIDIPDRLPDVPEQDQLAPAGQDTGGG